MKNIKKILLAVTLLATLSTLSAKEAKSIVSCNYIADIDCQSCVNKVMNTLPYQKGVKDVVVDLKSKSITVKYDASKSSNEAIISHLKKINIDATERKESDSECHDSGCCTK